jgi:hypothetical protein
MFFKIKPTKAGLKKINYFFLMLSIGLTACAPIGWVLENGTVSASLFLLFMAVFRYQLRNWGHPMWLCLSSWSFVYIEIPLFWYSLDGKAINPADGLPIDQVLLSEKELFYGLLCLATFYIAMTGANPRNNTFFCKPDSRFILNDKAFFLVLAIYLLIIVIIYYINVNLFTNRINKAPGFFNEIVRFCFHDAAIFFTLILLNIGRLRIKNKKNVLLVHTLLVLLYIGIFTSLGSKGAILTAFFLLIIAPIACAPILGYRKIILPKISIVCLLIGVGPLFYFMGQFFRRSLNPKSLASGDAQLAWRETTNDVGYFPDLVESILHRISAELNRYLLLAREFLDKEDNQLRSELFTYIGKNTANLLFPGTPFPESYTLSSMFLPNLINRESLVSGDYFDLMSKMNTQPFTFFGLSIFFFGLAAPLFFFIFCFFINLLMRSKSPLMAIGCLLFFLFSLSMYGIESVLQRSLMFVLNIYLIIFLAGILHVKNKSADSLKK